VSPTETPFLSAIPRNKATGTKHEWQIHALTAASSSNFVIEGDDATTDAATATTRLYNYCGISDKVALVTGTQDAVDKAGRRSEMAFQMKNRMKELKRDVEKILLENNAMVAGNDTTARECAGAQAWIITNANDASDASIKLDQYGSGDSIGDGRVTIYNAASATVLTTAQWVTHNSATGSAFTDTTRGTGTQLAASTITGFQLLAGSGNFTAQGSIRVYGSNIPF
jgi:hypothetical protein